MTKWREDYAHTDKPPAGTLASSGDMLIKTWKGSFQGGKVVIAPEKFSWLSSCLWLRSGHLQSVSSAASLYPFKGREEFPEKDNELHSLFSHVLKFWRMWSALSGAQGHVCGREPGPAGEVAKVTQQRKGEMTYSKDTHSPLPKAHPGGS